MASIAWFCRSQQGCAIERSAHLNASCGGEHPGGRRECEAVPSATQASLRQISAITIGQHLSNAAAVDNDVKTDRRFRTIGVLRPAHNATRPASSIKPRNAPTCCASASRRRPVRSAIRRRATYSLASSAPITSIVFRRRQRAFDAINQTADHSFRLPQGRHCSSRANYEACRRASGAKHCQAFRDGVHAR
jgi:hypothetical protein